MADDLRAQIAQALLDNDGDFEAALEAILPLVEQAIREERDKGDADVRLAQKAAQRALAEKDAQIAAFHKTIQDFADGTVNVSGTKREAGEVAQIQAVLAVVLSESRSQLLRETPAPPQTQETK